MGSVVNLTIERRRRRPGPQRLTNGGLNRDEQLLAAAAVLHRLKQDADQVLFLDAADVIKRLGPVYATILAAINKQEAAR